jgi:hypothetical protein
MWVTQGSIPMGQYAQTTVIFINNHVLMDHLLLPVGDDN